jgi:hypothetical protein
MANICVLNYNNKCSRAFLGSSKQHTRSVGPPALQAAVGRR